mmetsp:Transcript_70289/g.147147  ORF Transcript_70289/g.147147 Transcript_70289/m.147147 type:complete len:246 (+) Transcript_70289:206-943(+)
MKPMDRPRTKSPFRHPKSIKSSHSSLEKAPQDLIMSTKHTAMQPSTLRIKLARFLVVNCSTSSAKSSTGVFLKCCLAYSLMMTTRWSGFARDLMRWPMPMMSWLVFFILSMKSLGLTPLSKACANIRAASSKAPPNLGPMVRSPLQSAEMRSLPARAVTMVLCAPLTAGPWSAVTIKIISMNLQQAGGSCLRNHSSDKVPPMPMSFLKTSLMGMPQYFNSSPRSSEMELMKFAGFRTMPNCFAQV